MYIKKDEFVKRIVSAAKEYREKLSGKTFLIIYDKTQKLEVIFKNDSFLHLTGVGSKLYAKDFMKKACRNTLRESEIFFDEKHPADLADVKTKNLSRLYELIVKEVFLVDDIVTLTAQYAMGMTDLELLLCLGPNTDQNGKLLNGCKVPYSFRVEELKNEKFSNLYEVDFVFSKLTGTKLYTDITFGEKETICNLDEEIKKMLSQELCR